MFNGNTVILTTSVTMFNSYVTNYPKVIPTITIWLFNIAMENGPLIDDFPSKSSIYRGFSMAMLNNQMVDVPWIFHEFSMAPPGPGAPTSSVNFSMRPVASPVDPTCPAMATASWVYGWKLWWKQCKTTNHDNHGDIPGISWNINQSSDRTIMLGREINYKWPCWKVVGLPEGKPVFNRYVICLKMGYTPSYG